MLIPISKKANDFQMIAGIAVISLLLLMFMLSSFKSADPAYLLTRLPVWQRSSENYEFQSLDELSPVVRKSNFSILKTKNDEVYKFRCIHSKQFLFLIF
jgi:hypothetical protein